MRCHACERGRPDTFTPHPWIQRGVYVILRMKILLEFAEYSQIQSFIVASFDEKSCSLLNMERIQT
jgi:hypothetical protein